MAITFDPVLELLIDRSTGTLLKDVKSTVTRTLPTLVVGDYYKVAVRMFDPTGLQDNPWQEVDLTDESLGFSLGKPTADLSGNVTATYGANSDTFAVGASASTVSTTLNGLASITSDGGVSVTGPDGGPYMVTWDTAGARANVIALNVENVWPTARATTGRRLNGDSNTAEQQFLHIEPDVMTVTSSFSNSAAAAVTITTIQAGSAGVNEIQSVSLENPRPYGGTFTLTFNSLTTPPISYNATAAELQSALEATIALGGVSVSGQFPRWVVEFRGPYGSQNVAAMTGSAAGLQVPAGRVCNVLLSTMELYHLVAAEGAEGSVTAVLEVALESSGGRWMTIYRGNVTLVRDVIETVDTSQFSSLNYD